MFLPLGIILVTITACRASDFSLMHRVQTTPIDVSPGPLLFVIKPEGEPRHESVYVVDPESGGPPQRIMVTPGNIVFPRRIDRDRVLSSTAPLPRSDAVPRHWLAI